MNRIWNFNRLTAAMLALACGVGGSVACSDDDPVSPPVSPKDADRLGGKAGLEAFVKSVVETKILADADLKTFFFNQVATPIPAGHPSATQIVVCFARFVGTALGADAYPGAPVNDPANTNTPNHTCRDMVASHKGAGTMLNIGSSNFDKFIGHIATSLMPLVKPAATKAGEITQAEFDALAGALNGQKPSVTTAGAPSSGPFVPVN
jgi:hypothetical protein